MPEFGGKFDWSRKSGNLEAIELLETCEMRNLKGWEDGRCQRKETWGEMLAGGRED